MNNSVPVIQQTTNYDSLVIMEGNRSRDDHHIERLKKSMRQNMLFTIIFVNENMEIIDGQHRYWAIRQLSEEQQRAIPIHYVMLSGYKIKEVQIYNENVEEWSLDDVMESRIKMGDKEYELYKDFKTRSGLNHVSCLQLLVGSDSGNTMREVFRAGKLTIDPKRWIDAEQVARELNIIKEKFSSYNNKSFVRAYLRLREAENFKWEIMYAKLKSSDGGGLVLQNDFRQNLYMLITYYDRGLRRDNRIEHVSVYKKKKESVTT